MRACVRARTCVGVPGRMRVCISARACSLAYPVCNAHALDCIVICDLSDSATFFDIIS